LKRRSGDIPRRPATFEHVMRNVSLAAAPVRKQPILYNQFTALQLGDYVEVLISGR
jgi:hypothetical protein